MQDNDPIRRRIVINLDSPSSKRAGGASGYALNAKRSRRWPKVLAFFTAFVFVLVLIAIGGSYLWWRQYQTTPAYSVALLIDAAQRNEVTEFDKYVDDNEIAKRMVANVTQKVSARYGVALNASIQHEIDNVMPRLLPRVKQTIHDEVAKEIKEFAAKTEPKPFILIALAVPRFVSITTDNDTAKASAKLNERTINLSLKRDNDQWKVVEVNDDVLVQRIVDSVINEFPAIGHDAAVDLIKGLTKPKRGR
ncbi:MAG: hypothetical protein C5B55_09530 [Blastocatellia bacterium]|nr:MAG: hypothetical protein C5B55_09530 [Blastocatellia bacterium]